MTGINAYRIRIAHCGNGDDCPALDQGRDGGIEVTGYPVARDNLPEGEAVVWVPPTLLPEITALSIPNLGEWISSRHQRDLVRVQTRAVYDVASDADDYRRYLSGESSATAPAKTGWLTKLTTDAAAGKIRRNVHIVDEPLTDYLRYQFEWCYVPNEAAGQQIRILSSADYPAANILARCGDFTVIEGRHVARNNYTSDGMFTGASAISVDGVDAYAALAETAWGLGTPFAAWWAEHSSYHRSHRAA